MAYSQRARVLLPLGGPLAREETYFKQFLEAYRRAANLIGENSRNGTLCTLRSDVQAPECQGGIVLLSCVP